MLNSAREVDYLTLGDQPALQNTKDKLQDLHFKNTDKKSIDMLVDQLGLNELYKHSLCKRKYSLLSL